MTEINKTNLRLITRLIESGVSNEKDIMTLKLKDILSIPGITKAEMTAICELQEAGKNFSVMAFLTMPEKKEEGGTPNET